MPIGTVLVVLTTWVTRNVFGEYAAVPALLVGLALLLITAAMLLVRVAWIRRGVTKRTRALTLLVARTSFLLVTVLAYVLIVRFGAILLTARGPLVPLTVSTPLPPTLTLVPQTLAQLMMSVPATIALGDLELPRMDDRFTLLWKDPLLLNPNLLLQCVQLPLILTSRFALFKCI